LKWREKETKMTTTLTKNHTETKLLTDRSELRQLIEDVINTTPVFDVHTHVFPPEFGGMFRFGIDELLTYHYLIVETLRSSRVSSDQFWRMSRPEQADLVWKSLFVDNTPLSEAARGIVSVLDAFGLDPRAPDLREARAFFRGQNPIDHLNRVLDMACLNDIVMTNDPFDEQEAGLWNGGANPDPRFHASLRLDGLLNDWPGAAQRLACQDISVDAGLSRGTLDKVRNFLDSWIERMNPVYMAVSLPDSFKFPDTDARDRLIREVVLPTARENGLAFVLMVGVRRAVNPSLRAAGDGMGHADMSALERMCAQNPDVRFLATYLSRENQHELCVSARKFNNLMPFGCWWFLNNPSLATEITRQRIELLGPGFIPQHSDARVLEHLIYKWQHWRPVFIESMFEAYDRLLGSGRPVCREEIRRDVCRMSSDNFRDWVGLHGPEGE
jgi:hypothetical protein